jgi:hypothetical protein
VYDLGEVAVMAMVEVPIYAGLIDWVVLRQVREDEDGNGHSHHMGQSYYFRSILDM